MKPNVLFICILAICVFSVSSCKNNPVRKKLADPNSSYYMGMKKVAAQLDGDEEAVKFYSDPRNEGLNYYDLQRKNRQSIVQGKRYARNKKKEEEARKKEISLACNMGKLATAGFTGLTMYANSAVHFLKGKSPIKGAVKGHELAKKEVWVKGVKYACP
jgi:hypothetical protein